MDAEQAADVAVAGQHQRMAASRARAASPSTDAVAERVEPLERRRAAPRHEHRDRLSPSARSSRLSTALIAAATAAESIVLAVERQRRRDHRHVAQRQRFERRDVDRAAADLDGVLRGADHGGADAFDRALERAAPALEARADFLRQQRAEIAEVLRLAAVDEFRHAAGERDLGRSRRGVSGSSRSRPAPPAARRAAAHRLEQLVGHARGERARRLRAQRRAELELDAELGGEAPAGFLDAHDRAAVVEADEPRADVDRGEVDHLAVGADRDLRGAAADVDVHHRRLVADRARHRARAVGRHHGLQAVAGADRDQLAGLAREQFADGARVAPAHRDAGQDQRAGVDLVGIDLGVVVCCSMKAPSASASMVSSAE